MANHSSILAGIIPWTEESGRLQSTGWKELDMTELLITHTHRIVAPRNLLCVCQYFVIKSNCWFPLLFLLVEYRIPENFM